MTSSTATAAPAYFLPDGDALVPTSLATSGGSFDLSQRQHDGPKFV